MRALALRLTALTAIFLGAALYWQWQKVGSHDIAYNLSWQGQTTESVSVVEGDLYVYSLALRIDNMQLLACEHEHSRLNGGVALAGHGDEPVDVTKSGSLEELVVPNFDSYRLAARGVEDEYCGLHMAYGTTPRDQTPSLELFGLLVASSGEESEVRVSSDLVYGRNYDFEFKPEQSVQLALVREWSTVFDGVSLQETDEVIAAKLFSNLLDGMSISEL